MVPWTAWLGSGLQAALRRRSASLGDTRRWARDAGPVQTAQLRRLLEAARGTEFGRLHRFDALLRTQDDAALRDAFRRSTPVREYADLRPLLERMRRDAEPDVTWPGVVRDWAQTSGTTAGDKFMPVSRQLLAHNRRASMDVFAHAVRFGVPLRHLFAGRLLFLGGSTALETSDRGVRTGDLSGIVTRLIRWPLTAVYSPGPDVALMPSWPAKIERMARLCAEQDVRCVFGMASWALVLFQRVLELRRGRRARADLRDVWPNLRLFVHGGVRYEPFDARMREVWSGAPDGADIPARLEVYPASEAFVAVQDRPGDPGLRLNVDLGVYFEFIPLEDAGKPDPPAFACDEVETGVRYVVVLSTCAGLWRYVLGDVVEFDTVPRGGGEAGGEPPRLRIVGRHRHFINAFGENLIVEHIEKAVVEAARAAGAAVGEFTAAPVYPGDGRRAGIELAVEWSGGHGDLSRFAGAFDESLMRQNNDYTTKRSSDVGMGPPKVTPLEPGAFHAWLDRRGKLGGQHKCPRCANNRDIIDDLTQPAAKAAV